jgi:hypothetical protein
MEESSSSVRPLARHLGLKSQAEAIPERDFILTPKRRISCHIRALIFRRINCRLSNDSIEGNSSKEVYYESLSRYPLLAGVSQALFKKTLRTYRFILSKFSAQFGGRNLNLRVSEEFFSFLP